MTTQTLDRTEKRRFALSTIILIFVAVAVNMILGEIVQNVLQWPLYLDSIGTVLVGALLGPLAGALTGAVTNVLWSLLLQDPTILPYAVTAAFIGWAAGVSVARGAFNRISTVILAGLLTGVGAALISAPITANMFGGVTGSGTDYLIAYFQATGDNILQAATLEGIIVDPVDKAITFVIAWLFWRRLRDFYQPLSQRGANPFTHLSGYGGAVAVSALALLVSWVFFPAFGRIIFSVFYIAVAISAWRGGLGPAILSMIVGATSYMLLLLSPLGGYGVLTVDILQILIFFAVSIVIALITASREKANKALESALDSVQRSEARIRAVTNSVGEAMVLVSTDQEVIGINRTFSDMFEVPAESIRGQAIPDLYTLFDQIFADPQALFDLMLDSASPEREDISEVVVQNWPKPRELQLSGTPVSVDADYLGHLFVFRDITHEREVDRMKTEFVSLVSHELRTPLTSIKGFTDMILDGDAGDYDEEVGEFLEIVQSNADRLVALINDLLDISRIESGRIQLNVQDVQVQEVVDIVVATMQHLITAKEQTLAVELAPDIEWVRADRDKLIQVLTNYVSNAYKYTPAGGDIRIEITHQGDFALVAVSDNGYGIAAEDQEQLFTRFYRVDNSITREIGGTGLGLSIVKAIIELQGGWVSVTSAPGEGSTFSFTVPLVGEPPPTESESAQTVVPDEPDSRQYSILVVEDDPDISRLISLHLSNAGYEVDAVFSALAALEHLAILKPDLITLDIELPDMSGYELAAEVSKDERLRDIPILVLSVYSDEAPDLQIISDALPKPIDQEQLLHSVSDLLEAHDKNRLLVVEDDPGTQALLATQLGNRGYDVLQALDGETGLAIAQAEDPGLILLDLHLPDTDGFAVLEALKENPSTARIPVIIMTGSPSLESGTRARVLALGAADFVRKPFDMDTLISEISIFMNTTET